MAGVYDILAEARASTPEKDRLVERLNRSTKIFRGILENCTFGQLDILERTVFQDPWKNWDRNVGLTVTQLDNFAKRNEIVLQMPSRKQAIFLERLMKYTYDSGNSFYYSDKIREDILKQEDFDEKDLVEVEAQLIAEDRISVSGQMMYLSSLVFKEMAISETIKRMKNDPDIKFEFAKPNEEMYSNLTEKQKEVVDLFQKSNFAVMTGLPGTGKTYTISVIAKMYGEENVMLIAPTGKAARRISELAKMEARTIHSVTFQYTMSSCIVENCVIILDEASMLDIDIAGDFFDLIDTNSCKLLIVGDEEQLPAVGPGEFLHDLISSDIGNHVHLDEIKRQQPGSIILSAHAIARGEDIVQLDDGQISIYEYGKDLAGTIAQVAKSEKWPGAQFLTVLKERCADVINPIIQDAVNPGKGKWRVNDKILHLKNDKKNGVMNGDIGQVSRVISAGVFSVKYPDAEMTYPPTIHWTCSLAYAFTVHKAQGSEFPYVVLVLNRSRITDRNLLYTALTRASKKILILVEDRDDIAEAIDKKRPYRFTLLKKILNKEQ